MRSAVRAHARHVPWLLLALAPPAAGAGPLPSQPAPPAAAPPAAVPPAAIPSAAIPSAAAPPAAAELLAERARQLFDAGVRLAAEGHFELARAAFRGAYELQPHPSVLYNIAQCEVRLGDTSAAIATLERFLHGSGPELPAAQRRAVEQQLAELRALPRSRPGAPAAGPAALEPPAAAVPVAPPPAAAVPVAPPPVPAPPLRLRPFVLGGTGVLLLGAAASLYVWNDGRRDAWRTRRDELASTPAFALQLARDPALWDRARASNQRLDSIQTLDAVTLVVTGVGLAALGAGAWDLFAGSEPAPLQVGLAPLVRWHGRW